MRLEISMLASGTGVTVKVGAGQIVQNQRQPEVQQVCQSPVQLDLHFHKQNAPNNEKTVL